MIYPEANSSEIDMDIRDFRRLTDRQTDRRTDGRTDGRTERQTERQTDRQTDSGTFFPYIRAHPWLPAYTDCIVAQLLKYKPPENTTEIEHMLAVLSNKSY